MSQCQEGLQYGFFGLVQSSQLTSSSLSLTKEPACAARHFFGVYYLTKGTTTTTPTDFSGSVLFPSTDS